MAAVIEFPITCAVRIRLSRCCATAQSCALHDLGGRGSLFTRSQSDTYNAPGTTGTNSTSTTRETSLKVHQARWLVCWPGLIRIRSPLFAARVPLLA